MATKEMIYMLSALNTITGVQLSDDSKLSDMIEAIEAGGWAREEAQAIVKTIMDRLISKTLGNSAKEVEGSIREIIRLTKSSMG